MKNKKIAVLYGGMSSERNVSLVSGKAAFDALVKDGFKNVVLIDVDREIAVKLLAEKPDICLIALHGTYGEDGRIQGLLDVMGIAYTGSGCAASAAAFDKVTSKILFEKAKVPTAEYKVIKEIDKADIMPCVVKPAREGSTIGISIVKSAGEYKKAVEEALKFDTKVLVEKFVTGLELTVGILNGKCLPAIWIKPKSGFYDYESKYTKGMTEYIFETGLTLDETSKIQEAALRAFEALGCEQYGRVDIIFDGETPYVLEVNTLPGMTSTSLLPKAAARAGYEFADLLKSLLETAVRGD